MTSTPREPVRLSNRYNRMADICRDYAASAADSKVRDELLEMAQIYGDHAAREDAKEVPSNGIPSPSSAFRFADTGRKAGLGAQCSEYGSD